MKNLSDWLETHWATPSYGGMILAAIALAYFGAATNTMAGWLYVVSGISFALLIVGSILPVRSLRSLKIKRLIIPPVTVGDELTIEINITNQSNQAKTLLEIYDLIPYILGEPKKTAIEIIPAHKTHKWTYYHTTQKRGVYKWQTLILRTGSPLGLFWCQRSQTTTPETVAIVYPTVLPLNKCPLIDQLGKDESTELDSRDYSPQVTTTGITRGLRPYRLGDPTRLIHWRTSARYGDLKVRELEIFHGGEELIICLDTALTWDENQFEQAVIAAASLYFYANRNQLNVKLWTASTGLVHGNRVVLETLADTYFNQETATEMPQNQPILWLTTNPDSINNLPHGSRWLLWNHQPTGITENHGLVINQEQPLEIQLQSTLSRI
jgi:uncharacterized protein (DUF58 family)